MSTADALHQEISALEQRKTELAEQVDLLRRENQRRRDRLALLEAGRSARRRTRRWVLLWAVVIAAVVGYAALQIRSERRDRAVTERRLIFKPSSPQVMVTSKPEGARVWFAGGSTPEALRGKQPVTPLAFDARGGEEYRVTVSAEGHAPRSRTLNIGVSGVHWHAELETTQPEK